MVLAATVWLIVGLALLIACSTTPEPEQIAAANGDVVSVETRIVRERHDAEEFVHKRRGAGDITLSSSDLDLGTRSGEQTVGLYFDKLAIPQGVVIRSAYVQFTADESHADEASFTIHGQAADDAERFERARFNLTSREPTDAVVAWTPAPWTVGDRGPAQRTADLTPVVQEIVSRSGWKSGNALVLIIAGEGRRVAEAYKAGASKVATLQVEYSTTGDPGGPTNSAPQVDAGPDMTITLASPVTFDLNGSVDDDGLPDGSLTTSWSKVSGPGDVAFADASAAATTATISVAGEYVLRLDANDGALTSSDQVTVMAQQGETPPPPPPPPPGGGSDVTLPVRAAFYYPWFPETWTVGGQHVKYQPVLGYYDNDDQAVVDAHIRALDYAKVEVGIASWWGPDTHNETVRVPMLLDRTQALGSTLKWAFYYEKEGFGNPSLNELSSDLAYIEANYASSPSYARIDGKPVLFVYNADDSSCTIADRWTQVTGGNWYLVLKVFPGYRNCATQPDSWHQYAPAVAVDHQGGHSYAISPGFWRADEGSPRLARDFNRWQQNVRDMVASNEPWQLITTFNEWGEGTAIEEEEGWGTSFLDALATDGGGDPPPPPPPPAVTVSLDPASASLTTGESATFTATVSGSGNTNVTWSATGGTVSGSGTTVTYTAPTTAGSYTLTATSVADPSKEDSSTISVSTTTPPPPPPDPGTTVTVGAAGDFGGRDDRAGLVMDDMKGRSLDAFFLLGDLMYDQRPSEQAWCDWVHSYLGADYPFQVVGGNHEDDNRSDGYILNFRQCMPDRLGSDLGPGGYAVNYAFDLGPVTVVATSPAVPVAGYDYRYRPGSPERQWLVDTVRTAKSEGDWVVVGMHKNCITMGDKGCEIGEEFAQLLVEEGVDLVLQGHDHNYQRSHALSTLRQGGVGTIADSGGDGEYARGAGTVFVIVGTVGRGLYGCSHSDSEAGNFAVHFCREESATMKGYLKLTASRSRLGAEFVVTHGSFTDAFVIR